MPSNTSFAEPIRIVRDNTQKLLLTSFYFPLFVPYCNLEEKIGPAFQSLGEKRIDGETLPSFIDALSEFDFEMIKEIFNKYPLLISQALLQTDEDDKFFSEMHGSVKPIFAKHSPTEQKLQSARNSLQNFSRIFYSDVSELEKAWRYIDSSLKQTQDTTANVRQGMTGGAIGAALGTMLFPGLGTVAGGALGGYVMSKMRNNSIVDQIHEHVIKYYQSSRNIIGLLHNHARECYLINGRIFDEFVLARVKATYSEIKSTYPAADTFVIDYVRNQESIIQSFYATEVSEGCGYTWGEATTSIEQFLTQPYSAA
jgi:hypothetical protein